MPTRACVIGSGSFGTALAQTLSRNFSDIRMWGREAELAERINSAHENAVYLKGIPLAPHIRATLSLKEALTGAELVLVALPSHATRSVMTEAIPYLPAHVPIVSVAKGIENDTLLTQTEVLESVLPVEFHPYLAVLSGPSFAKELVQGLPTVVTIASSWNRVATSCQDMLKTETFRSYTTVDVVGVQLGGALKNVIAIASGMSDGLGFGHNARSALITRGLAEISAHGRAPGRQPADPQRASPAWGTWCSPAPVSSRATAPWASSSAGAGRLADVLAQMNQVAEGVKTARSARDLGPATRRGDADHRAGLLHPLRGQGSRAARWWS